MGEEKLPYVVAHGKTMPGLQDDVNAYIKKGYEVKGGIFRGVEYYQALVYLKKRAAPRKRVETTPFTLTQVKEYISERKMGIDAEYFYEYYKGLGFKDTKGLPIHAKNFKAKCLYWERLNQDRIGPIEDVAAGDKPPDGWKEFVKKICNENKRPYEIHIKNSWENQSSWMKEEVRKRVKKSKS